MEKNSLLPQSVNYLPIDTASYSRRRAAAPGWKCLCIYNDQDARTYHARISILHIALHSLRMALQRNPAEYGAKVYAVI